MVLARKAGYATGVITGILISLWGWAILAYSRIAGPPVDTDKTREYFSKIGVHFDE